MILPTISNLLIGIAIILIPFQSAVAQINPEEKSRAIQALNRGDYDEVRDILEPVLDKLSGNDRVMVAVYFDSYLETGEFEAGLERVQSLLIGNPEDPYLLTAKGEFLTRTGRYEEAAEAFEQADSGDGNDWRNIYYRAELYMSLGRRPEAYELFNRLVSSLKAGKLKTPWDFGYAAKALSVFGEYHDANEAFITANKIYPENSKVLEWWAELFADKFNPDQARANFEEALSINPDKADLYTGYARVVDSFAQKEELARTALEKNPESIEARNILAEVFILDSRYDEAEKELAEALSINPNSISTLAYLASVFHLRDEKDKLAETIERVLDINPYAGEFYYIIAENCIRRFRYKDAVYYGKQAIERDRRFWKAYALVGTNLLRTGNVDEANMYLERAYDRDPFNLFASNTLNLIDGYDEFETLESEHFTIILHKSESRVLGKAVADLAEAAYDSLSQRYPYRPPGKIKIEGYNDHDDFAVRIKGLPGISLLGVCFGDVVAFETPSARIDYSAQTGQPADRYNWSRTLWHELAHVMALGTSDHRVPRWFTEGLSVFEEKRAHPAWGREMDLQFYNALDNDLLLSLEEMNEGFTRPKYPGQVMMSYYHASRILEFISDEYGFSVVIDLLEKFREGDDLEQAFGKAFGSDTRSIERRFLAQVRAELERFKPVLAGLNNMFNDENQEKSFFDTLEDHVTSASNPFFDALKNGYSLLEENEYSDAENSFLEALDLFPDYIENRNPYEGLASIYRIQERTGDLQAILERYLTVTEYGRDESQELAALFKSANIIDQAERYLRRSLQVQPYDITTYSELAELYKNTGRLDDEIDQRRIIVALEPPDKAKALHLLGDSLYRSGQLSEAKLSVLKALEISPGYREAQKLLLLCIQNPN